MTATDDAAAARALRDTNPDVAETFLAAAQGLKPQSDRPRIRMAKLISRRHSQTDAAPDPTIHRRAQNRAARPQKATKPSG